MPAPATASAPAPACSAPPADPYRVSFRVSGHAPARFAVDPACGVLSGVSLMTADREAAGHGVWIDAQSLASVQKLIEGRRLKAYVTHAWGDSTLDEPGYWANSAIDGLHLRADFTALDAWRKHQPAAFDTLFELAAKLPDEFGVSLTFRMDLVWVRRDGTEVPTRIRYRNTGDWEYERYYDPAAPADAVRGDMPSCRATAVYSADFVDTPAANDALFRAAPPVDAPATHNSPPMISTKDLHARFGTTPDQLARAIALSVGDESLTLDQISTRLAAEDQEKELKSLRADKAAFAEKETKFAADLKAKDDELAKLRATITAHEATIAGFRKGPVGGSDPIDTGAAAGDGAGDGKTVTKAQFDAMTPAQKQKFSVGGGRISG